MSENKNSTVFDKAWWDELYRESEEKHQRKMADAITECLDLTALGMRGVPLRAMIDPDCPKQLKAAGETWYRVETNVEIGRLVCRNGEWAYSVICVLN